MPSEDELLDAYVFVPSGSEDTMAKLKELWSDGYVRYATRVLSGAYGSVAFVEASSLVDLRDRLTKVRNAVNPGTSVGIALRVGDRVGVLSPTRWSTKKAVGAYVRIRATAGMAGEVFDLVEKLPSGTYFRSTLVLGDWDVLLELGADTFGEMKEVLYGLVGPGGVVPSELVLWTDSAIVLSDVEQPVRPGDQ